LLFGHRSVGHLLQLDRRDVADLSLEPTVIELVDVLEGRELDLVALAVLVDRGEDELDRLVLSTQAPRAK
jgi:hypothetical protein